MSLSRMDHVAIEVADIDPYIDKLVATGGLRLLRRGVVTRTGARLAMLGDPLGMKVELIENAAATVPRLVHIAFRSGDVDAASRSLLDTGWVLDRGPVDLKEAEARSVIVNDGGGFELQVLTYSPTSPDVVEWEPTSG